jgi:hypothetical protein
LLGLVAPYYSKGETGRKPVGLEIMLRVYFLQQSFALSDPAVEEALYESAVLRRFAGVDLGSAPAPDETTILNLRHLLEEHQLCGQMLDTVNYYLESRGIRIATGTIVDATIIHAPSSTKNEKKERDPAMHQTRRGNQWYFGMKAHIGVDSKEGCTSPKLHPAEKLNRRLDILTVKSRLDRPTRASWKAMKTQAAGILARHRWQTTDFYLPSLAGCLVHAALLAA